MLNIRQVASPDWLPRQYQLYRPSPSTQAVGTVGPRRRAASLRARCAKPPAAAVLGASGRQRLPPDLPLDVAPSVGLSLNLQDIPPQDGGSTTDTSGKGSSSEHQGAGQQTVFIPKTRHRLRHLNTNVPGYMNAAALAITLGQNAGGQGPGVEPQAGVQAVGALTKSTLLPGSHGVLEAPKVLLKQQVASAQQQAEAFVQQLQQQQKQQQGPPGAGEAAGTAQGAPSSSRHAAAGPATAGSAAAAADDSTWLVDLLQPPSGHCHWAVAAAVLAVAGPVLQLRELELVLQGLVAIAAPVAACGPSPGPRSLLASSMDKGRQQKQQQPVVGAEVELSPADLKELGLPNRKQVAGMLAKQLTRAITQGDGVGGGDVSSPAAVAATAKEKGTAEPGAPSEEPALPPAAVSAPPGASAAAAPTPPTPHHMLQLLLKLQQLQGSFGGVYPQLLGRWLGPHQLQQLPVGELGRLLCAAAELQLLLKASWLEAALAAAVGQLQGAEGPEVCELLLGLSKYPNLDRALQALDPLVLHLTPQLQQLPLKSLRSLMLALPRLRYWPPREWQDQMQAAYLSRLSSRGPAGSWEELLATMETLQEAGWNPGKDWVDELCALMSRRVEEEGGGAVGKAAETRKEELDGEHEQEVAGAAATAAEAGGVGAGAGQGSVVPPAAGATAAGGAGAGPGAAAGGAASTGITGRQLLGLMRCFASLGWRRRNGWVAALVGHCLRNGSLQPLVTLELIPLLPSVLQQPASFNAGHPQLLRQLLAQLQDVLPQADGTQLADLACACLLLGHQPSKDFLQWHASAAVRVGPGFRLDDLARVRDAYGQLGFIPEGKLTQLLGGVAWRLRVRRERQQQEEQWEADRTERGRRQKQRLAALDQKRKLREKRERSRKKQRELEEKTWRGPAGSEPSGRANWRSRKLKPPGTLDKQW